MLDPMASLILAGGLLLSMFGVELFERANRRDSADHTR
jgi:hypothetical protein